MLAQCVGAATPKRSAFYAILYHVNRTLSDVNTPEAPGSPPLGTPSGSDSFPRCRASRLGAEPGLGRATGRLRLIRAPPGALTWGRQTNAVPPLRGQKNFWVFMLRNDVPNDFWPLIYIRRWIPCAVRAFAFAQCAEKHARCPAAWALPAGRGPPTCAVPSIL